LLQEGHDEYGKLLPFNFTCATNGTKAKDISGTYMLLKNSMPLVLEITGNPSDWKDIPAIDLGSGVSVKTSVLEEKLLVAVEVKGQNLVAEDVFAGVGLYIDPFGKTNQWHLSRVATQDLAIFEFIKTEESIIEAFCHYVQGTQAGSGSSYLVSGGVQKRIDVKTSTSVDSAFMVFSIPQEVLSPLILKSGSRFGINISVPLKTGGVKTLAPVDNFKTPSEPGKICFITGIVCD